MYGTKHIKKQLLGSGRNSAMQVASRIICILLLMAQKMPEIQGFFVDFLADFWKY